jgi:aminoglycoside 6'-N-acetyltransferase
VVIAFPAPFMLGLAPALRLPAAGVTDEPAGQNARMELTRDRVRLRPVRDDHIDRLTEIITAPEVAQWWGAYDRARVAQELLGDAEHWFVIEHAGLVVGTVGYWEEEEPDYRHAGIDITLHPDWLGQGLGSEAIVTLARWLFDERDHHRITIDPAASNARAIRCYQRVGFRPVGVMRRYERTRDGTWRDALLMDLLREELNPCNPGTEPQSRQAAANPSQGQDCELR